ncbi:hypothetical protein IP88_03630 [alpha proteobacterium AAP81b]|nr:hypothetical protein IP88_03630 [alpha proteobacterium AAP81b]
MPTDFHRADPLIDALVADLAPVRPRRWWREAALLAGAVVVEAFMVAEIFGMRPTTADALMAPAFMWKTASLTLVAIIGAAAALLSLDPAVTGGRRIRWLWGALALLLPVALAAGWLIDAGAAGSEALLHRLDWRAGLGCVRHVVMTALPMLLVLAVVIRRGAPTNPERTAAAAGLAAAGLSAAGFVLSCPHDDPLYVAVWYGLAVALITGVSRLLLPRLIRW